MQSQPLSASALASSIAPLLPQSKGSCPLSTRSPRPRLRQCLRYCRCFLGRGHEGPPAFGAPFVTPPCDQAIIYPSQCRGRGMIRMTVHHRRRGVNPLGPPLPLCRREQFLPHNALTRSGDPDQRPSRSEDQADHGARVPAPGALPPCDPTCRRTTAGLMGMGCGVWGVGCGAWGSVSSFLCPPPPTSTRPRQQRGPSIRPSRVGDVPFTNDCTYVFTERHVTTGGRVVSTRCPAHSRLVFGAPIQLAPLLSCWNLLAQGGTIKVY